MWGMSGLLEKPVKKKTSFMFSFTFDLWESVDLVIGSRWSGQMSLCSRRSLVGQNSVK